VSWRTHTHLSQLKFAVSKWQSHLSPGRLSLSAGFDVVSGVRTVHSCSFRPILTPIRQGYLSDYLSAH